MDRNATLQLPKMSRYVINLLLCVVLLLIEVRINMSIVKFLMYFIDYYFMGSAISILLLTNVIFFGERTNVIVKCKV